MRVTLGLSVLLFATLACGQNEPFTITSDTAQPTSNVGTPYSQTLTVTGGGVAPFHWSLQSGILPAGLTLTLSTGPSITISGTPTQAGPQTFTISVTDAYLFTASQTFTVNISPVNCSFSVPNPIGFPATGGAADVTINAAVGCAWAATGAPMWVKFSGASSGNGPGTLNLSAGPNLDVATLSGSMTIGNSSVTVTQPSADFGFLPHLAALGGWNTTFTLVNLDVVPVNTKLNLLSSAGALLPVPETLPQQPSSPTFSTGVPATVIAPGASLLIEASGPSDQPFVEGSAQLAGTGNILGFAIFHYDPSGQEAVVPLDVHPGYDIPFDNTNGVTTGVAVENLIGSPMTVPVTLVDDSGNSLGAQQSITLPAYGHTSFVLPTQFPVTANLRGAAIFGSCTAVLQPFNSYYQCTEIDTLGIRYTPPGTLTTIPQSVSSYTSGVMPHIASGNGWQTTFVLTNLPTIRNGLITQPAQARLTFFDDNGNALPLPLTFPQTGATMTTSNVTQSIPANGTLYIQTSGDIGTALLTGSAHLTGASGYAIFRYNPNGQEAVVPIQSIDSGWVLAFDNTNNVATGVAVSNSYAQAVTVPVTIRDDQGNQIGTSTVSLPANGHTSFMLAQQLPVTAGIRGTLEFRNTQFNAVIGVLGIRSPPQLTFTTLPALSEAKLR